MLSPRTACVRAARLFLLELVAFSSVLIIACAAFTASAAAATPVTPQQLTVTAANAAGDSIYDLSLATGSSGALISGIQALNSDGVKHGSFDALVWSPNAFTGTLDLIVADATKGQILRYAGPNYGTSSMIFTYTGKGSGPAYPAGLAVDGAGNVLVISPSAPISASPALWVLPFNKATGAWGAPVLVDDSFGGVRTLALAEVLVAGTAATPDGNAAPAWNAGDVLVLVGDTFDSRVIVYSQAAVTGVLARPKVPLTGPTSTAITSREFLSLLAAPFGMDIWPADATHGVSLLFTTIDGRIVRFDTHENAFAGNFASGLGLGLTKLKVGAYAGKPYAFVAQLGPGSNGKILQFGAPPASGANQAVASVTKGVSEPVGLALTSSGSTPANSCVAPNSCSPLGPQLTVQISGPGAAKIPAGATILQQACTVPTDPRVKVTGGVWSCLPSSMTVCGAAPTPGCVPATLDVANYCPGFPSTILPATMCGHAGANGASFQVVKGTAELLDENANDIYIQSTADPMVALPGPYDLGCQQGVGQPNGQVVAFAPRSDLPTIEGTIVEDTTAPFFADLTSLCDKGAGNTHVESMFAFGLGLNTGPNGLGSGANNGLYGFVTTKFNNLSAMIQDAASAQQITPQSVTATLENYVTQSQTYFNNDYNNDVNDYSCALNSIASADAYLRNQAMGPAFRYTAPAVGNNNPNPAGEIDSRLANLYLSISGDFLYAPNPTWPTSNVPPCVTLTVSSPLAVGSSGTLTYGPPVLVSTSTPLIDTPTQCTLQATDGTYATPVTVPYTGVKTTVSTGTLKQSGTYKATLECSGASGDASSSFATASVTVSSQPPPPTLQLITLTPGSASILDGQIQQFRVTGLYSDGSSQTLSPTSFGWTTTNSAVAPVSASGVASCISTGTVGITATSGNFNASAGLVCSAPPLASIIVTPATPAVNAGTAQQFTATGYDAYNNQTPLYSVAWSSSNSQIAISSNGTVTCALDGSSTITATASGGGTSTSGSTTITCEPGPLAFLTLPAAESVPVGSTYQYYPIGMDAYGNVVGPGSVTWVSSSPTIATVGVGLVTCLSSGTSTITATSGNIVSNGSLLNCTTQTTYQYTGIQFSSGNAHVQYTTSDRVIASMTFSQALPASMNNIAVTTLPGFVMTMSDGVQTLATGSNVQSLGTVNTDSIGNIIYWSLTNETPPGSTTGSAVNTQNEAAQNEGAIDTAFINLGNAEDCIDPPTGPMTDCGANSGTPGSWTSTNLQSLHVMVGTTSGTSPATGQLYEVTLNSTPGIPPLSVSTILSETPEPTSCFSSAGSVTSGVSAAISSLAFVPNGTTGYTDLVGSNGSVGDVFLMSGPSYQPTADLTNASTACSGKGPINIVVAADASGDVVGAGIDSQTGNPGLYYFPPNPGHSADYVFIADVNASHALSGYCHGMTDPGCVSTLADAVVAPIAVAGPGIAAGDLLVLVGDVYAANSNPVVMRLSSNDILTSKSAPTGSATPFFAGPNVGGSQVITQSSAAAPAPPPNTIVLGNTESPVSMDISPLDGSLFIATSSGNIYKLTPNAGGYGTAVLYASNAPGIQKIRVGVNQGILYLFATVQSGSANAVIEYVGTQNLPLTPTATAPLTIGTPAGLAVH
jgi:hypothetical protein